MSIGVLLRGFIGDMMDFGDVILRTLFPSFMTIQACREMQQNALDFNNWILLAANRSIAARTAPGAAVG
jgi:hypothetical protein